MSQLKKLQSWISAYKKANDVPPDEKAISFKIKELLKEEVIEKKSKSEKIYFRDSEWNDYDHLRLHLAKDENFVKEFAGVDLKAYINDVLTWSEGGKTSTNLGWLLTLKKWMRMGKDRGNLLMRSDVKPKTDNRNRF